MLKRATAVIGSGFGDEGKGLFTDYHAARRGGPRAIVCRYNGGAQAGHTVLNPDGRRHVFSHFGAGTFAGAETYLSSYFITNPLIFRKEWDELDDIRPTVWIDGRAIVTTPFDMLINQELEDARGITRHGSCGLGINETVERSRDPEFIVQARDLDDPQLGKRLRNIQLNWVPKRLAALGIEAVSAKNRELLDSDFLLAQFLDARDLMVDRTTIAPPDIMHRSDTLIFEGAQGLLLDEKHQFFPHVTRSRTGLNNVALICRELGIEDVDAYYVTRPYATRHGPGPFPSADPTLRFEDKTNHPNPWQGSLRFGRLDVQLLRKAITTDLTKSFQNGIYVHPTLAVSWADVFADRPVELDTASGRISTNLHDAMVRVAEECAISDIIMADGQTRDDVVVTR